MIKNTGTYFDMRKRPKTPLGKKFLYVLIVALLLWCVDSLYSVYLKYKIAKVLVAAFPAIK